MCRRRVIIGVGGIIIVAAPDAAHAATALDGATMSWPWALPFLGILLSIAIGPLLFPKVWHRHYGKIAAGWSLLALTAIATAFGASAALAAVARSRPAQSTWRSFRASSARAS